MIGDVQIGRVRLPTLHAGASESLGHDVSVSGPVLIAGDRRPTKVRMTLPLHAVPGAVESVIVAGRLNRQLRGMISNPKLRSTGIPLVVEFDPDQGGWIVVSDATLTPTESAYVHGDWTLELGDAVRIAALRTHYPVQRIEWVDRRLAASPRDILGKVTAAATNANFAGMSIMPLAWLSLNTNAWVVDLATGASSGYHTRLCREGGPYLGSVWPTINGTAVRYDVAESASWNGGVIVYDRRGWKSAVSVPYQQNICPNPSFELGTAGWSVAGSYAINGGSQLQIETRAAKRGRACAALVTPGAQQWEGVDFAAAVTSGQAYTFSVWMRAGEVSGSFPMSLVIGSAATGQGEKIVTVVPGWQRYTLTFTPTGTGTARVGIRTPTGTPVSRGIFFDEAMLNTGMTVLDNFDGDMPGCTWQGTPGNSASLRFTFEETHGWEEVYGPDHELTPNDCPVLDNGVCRVRFVQGTYLAWAVDYWDNVTLTYVEAGRMTVGGHNSVSNFECASGFMSQGHAVSLVEWTPDRAVIRVDAVTATAMLRVYITLQRGWTAPRFEVYTQGAYGAATTPGAWVSWSAVDAGGPFSVAHGDLTAPVVDKALQNTFSPIVYLSYGTENWIALQSSIARLVTLAAVQTTGCALVDWAHAYGTDRRSVMFWQSYGTSIAGYASMQAGIGSKGFHEESEVHRIATGTTSVLADGTANGGSVIKDTQITEANRGYDIATPLTTLGIPAGKYAIFGRLRVMSGTGSARVLWGTTFGVIKTVTTTWQNLWLGDIDLTTGLADVGMTFWGAGADTRLDTVFFVPVEKQLSGAINGDGARDLGRQALADVRSVQVFAQRG